MNRTSTLALLTLMLAVLTTAAVSQDATTALEPPQVRVEVTTDKKDYMEGDRIRFRVALVSLRGPAIYIAKSWSYAGGGIAGFDISIEQLSGRPPKLGCAKWTGDRFISEDSRSPEQILREDFVRLLPGESVGFEDEYDGCAVGRVGTYKISATYSANDPNTHKVASLSDEKNSVLTGTIYSRPFTFRVHSGRKTTNRSPNPGS